MLNPLLIIIGSSCLDIPYTNQQYIDSILVKTYVSDKSSVALVFLIFMTCGTILNAPSVAAAKPIVSVQTSVS
jgi:hypothetical protein